MVAGVTLPGLLVLGLVFAGGVIGLALARVAWRNREAVPGARSYAAVVAAAGLWCLAYFGVIAAGTFFGAVEAAATWLDPLVTVFAMATPFAWLLFTLEYTGHDEWLTRRRVAVVLAEPVAYYALYLTNPVHGLLFDGYGTFTWQGLVLLSPRLTDLVFVQVLFLYAVTLAGGALLVAFIMRTRNVHRRQALAILVGAALTTAGNVLFVAGVSPHPALDVTPVFFVANGVVVAWALFRYDFLSVAPVARDALVEAMDDPVVVLDGDGAVVDSNPAAARTLGVDDDALGCDVEECLRGLTAALDADGAVALETVDGEAAVFDPRPTPLTDRQDVERGRLVVLREVTLLKRREQTLAALQSATRELMNADRDATVAAVVVATAADVLDHEFAGYLAYDPDSEVLRSTTLTPSVATRVPDGELTFGPGDGLVWETFEGGEVVVEDEIDAAGGGATDLPVASAVLLPLGDHGLLGVGSLSERAYDDDDEVRFLKILASAAESTLDRLSREREMREHRDALEERNERLENFASIVSHDLRTPLTTATGYLALARQDLEDPEGYLGRVADSHERMESLVEDLLALARQGQVVDDPEPVPVGEVALNAWQTAGHVDASIDVAPFPGDIVADRERVRTVLENLLGNAVEHVGTDVSVQVGPIEQPASADGGRPDAGTAPDAGGAPDADGSPEAGVGGTSGESAHGASATNAETFDEEDPTAAVVDAVGGTHDDNIGFYVADDGPGIPPDERDEVFEQGYSGDTGTGLGLAIVDRIAGAHDWDVAVTESEDGGARFEFMGIDRAE